MSKLVSGGCWCWRLLEVIRSTQFLMSDVFHQTGGSRPTMLTTQALKEGTKLGGFGVLLLLLLAVLHPRTGLGVFPRLGPPLRPLPLRLLLPLGVGRPLFGRG